MILLVAAAVLVGAALQSATGFGFALVTAPVLFVVLDPAVALTTMIVLTTLLSLLVLVTERRDLVMHTGVVVRLAAAAVPGLVVGVLLLDVLGKPPLQVGVGVVVVAAALVEVRAFATARAGGAVATPWPLLPVGFATGVLTTTTGVNGPPLLIYFQRLGSDPHEMRDSLAACFLLYGPLGALALLATDNLSLAHVGVAELALLLVLVALGRPLGRWLFLRMSATHFRVAGVALAVLAGVSSIVAGLAS